MKTTHTFISLLAASLLLGITPILAEDAAAGGGAGANAGRRAGGGAAFQNMTDEQRQALQQVNEEIKDLNTKATEARKELGAAVYAEKVDEAQIREKAAALAKVDADVAVARAKAFAKVRSKFTSEQIEAFKNMPAGMGGRMGGGGGRRPAAAETK